MLDVLSHAFSHIPSLLMILIGTGVLFWVVYLAYALMSDKMGADKSIYLPYCYYAFSIAGWIYANAYFQSDLLLVYGKQLAITMAIIANLFCASAMFFAYLFSCKIVSTLPRKRLRKHQLIIAFGLIGHGYIVNMIPGETVVDIDIYSAGDFVLHFGDSNTLFFLSAPILITLTLINFLKARKSPQRLRQIKLSYMMVGVTSFMVSTLFVLIAIPLVYSDFSLVWLPPVLAVIEALLIGYALLHNRFYSLRYITLIVTSFMINAVVYLVPMLTIASYGNSLSVLIVLAVWMLISGVLYYRSLMLIRAGIKKILYKEEEHPIDNICSLIGEFQYSSDKAIVKLNQLLNANQGYLQRVDDQQNNVFLKYFRGDRRVLIKQELEYAISYHNKEDNSDIKALTEAMTNTGTSLVLPITDHAGRVSHLYMVSKDNQEELFSSEEILGLQALFDEANKWIVSEDKVRKAQVLAGSIAHEIRNPFSKLNYHFERIDADMFGSDSTTLERFASDDMRKLYQELTESKKAVMLGTRFIDAILSEINGNGISSDQFAYYSAGDLTVNALNDFNFQRDEDRERVTLVLADDFMFFGSETLFSFVIYNLLKNASCYFDSHPDSRIEIRLYRRSGENHVVVSDTGPGISKANQARIFDDFFTHNKKHGTGLGLAYCKRVMESFGGAIHCVSVEGESTEFTLVFPLVDEQQYNNILRDSLVNYLDHTHGLIVGSEQAYQLQSDYLLSDFTIELSQIGHDLDGFDMKANHSFDFILITDCTYAAAYDIAKAMRSSASMCYLPIIYCQTSVSRDESYQYISSELFQGCIMSQSKRDFWRSLAQVAQQGGLNRLGTLVGKRVLVVDDMQVNRMLVHGYLSREGVEVFQAASGQEAIEKVESASLDLIFMDIHMPNMDGIETTQRIRQLNSSIPIVSLTGEYSPDVIQVLEALMDDHLEKPVSKTQLINMLTKWCMQPQDTLKGFVA